LGLSNSILGTFLQKMSATFPPQSYIILMSKNLRNSVIKKEPASCDKENSR